MSQPKATARNKMMDLLAIRQHTELEIQQKLLGKFEPDLINEAIEFAKKNGWLPSTEQAAVEMSENAAAHLHRKKKGILYINAKLQEKGLPEVESDPEQELEKAFELVKNKYSTEKEIPKLGRFLISRGFDENIVRKVIYEKFKSTLPY